jgi:hypothetical protein
MYDSDLCCQVFLLIRVNSRFQGLCRMIEPVSVPVWQTNRRLGGNRIKKP